MNGDEHLDLDTLADYAEGVLGDKPGHLDEAAIRSHLAGCAECRGRAEQLADVSHQLAATPAPEMPADVSARIDEVIAAEERERTVVPLSHKERRGGWTRSMRLGGAAASVALIVVAGVFGLRAVDGGAGSAGSATGSSAQGESLAREGSGSSQDIRPRSRGSGPSQGIRPQSRPHSPADAPVTAAITVSGRDYSSRRLAQQAAELLEDEQAGSDGAGSPGVRVKAATPVPTPLRSLTASRNLTRCVSKVTGRGDDNVLAIDLASYSGKPSAVIVAEERPSARADVWVVGPSCSQVRAHTEIARNPE